MQFTSPSLLDYSSLVDGNTPTCVCARAINVLRRISDIEYPYVFTVVYLRTSCTYVRRAPVSWFADEVFVGKKRHGRFGCRHRVSPRKIRRLRPWRFRGIRGIYTVNARTKRYQTTHSSKIKKKKTKLNVRIQPMTSRNRITRTSGEEFKQRQTIFKNSRPKKHNYF